jgi:ankyrin repeat protein
MAVVSLAQMSLLANPGDDLFASIRRADISRVKALLQSGADPNVRDASGVPALMRAVVYQPAEGVRLFLDRGADVNATSRTGATALMWAAPDTGKVRLLLDRGARPNLRALDGATALVAAARFSNADAMRLLMSRGADPKASANGAVDLFRIAYGRNDQPIRRLLAERGLTLADPKQVAGAIASTIEHHSTVLTLLESGADPNEPVRLGTLAMPSLSMAAHVGVVDGLSLLIDRGANPNVSGPRGLTPLMVAAAANRSDPAPVRVLLDRGADVHARDDSGRTALDWALMRGESQVASVLRLAGARGSLPLPGPAPVREPRPARAAIEAALQSLLPTGVTFQQEAGCISCHHQSLPAMAATLAARRGVPIDATLASHPTQATLAQWRLQEEQLLSGATRGVTFGFIANSTYGLLALAEAGVAATPAVDAVVLRLAAFQDADGGWYPGHVDTRPPLDGSPITRAALAIRAMSVYAPPGRRAEMRARIARARRFVAAATPLDTARRGLQAAGADLVRRTSSRCGAAARPGARASAPGRRMGTVAWDGARRICHRTGALRAAGERCEAGGGSVPEGRCLSAPHAAGGRHLVRAIARDRLSAILRHRVPARPQPVHLRRRDRMGRDRAGLYRRSVAG